VHRAVCLFTFNPSLLLRLSTEDGQAELTGLATEMACLLSHKRFINPAAMQPCQLQQHFVSAVIAVVAFLRT